MNKIYGTNYRSIITWYLSELESGSAIISSQFLKILQSCDNFNLLEIHRISSKSDADDLVQSLAYFPDKLEVVDFFAADFQKEICFHFSRFETP